MGTELIQGLHGLHDGRHHLPPVLLLLQLVWCSRGAGLNLETDKAGEFCGRELIPHKRLLHRNNLQRHGIEVRLSLAHDVLDVLDVKLLQKHLSRIKGHFLQEILNGITKRGHTAGQSLLHDLGFCSGLRLHHRGPHGILHAGHLLNILADSRSVVKRLVERRILLRLNQRAQVLPFGIFEDRDLAELCLSKPRDALFINVCAGNVAGLTEVLMQHLGVTGLVVLLLQAFHQVYKRRRNKRIDNLIERQQEEREPPAPHLLWRVRFTQEVLAAVAHRVDALAAPVQNFKNHHLIVRPDIVRGRASRREFFAVERFSCRFGVNGSAVNLDLVRVLNVLPAHRYTLAHPVGLRVVREIADHRIDDELISRHPVDHKAGNRLRLRILLIAGDCL